MKPKKLLLVTTVVTLFSLGGCSTPATTSKNSVKLTPVELLPETTITRTTRSSVSSRLGRRTLGNLDWLPESVADDMVENTGIPAPERTPQNINYVQAHIKNMIDECKPILSNFENQSNDGAKKAFWLSVAGLISGSVIAPTLTAANASSNATAIAAFSSFGGATNSLTRNLESSGLGGSHAAQTRNGIIERIRKHLEDAFVDTGNLNDQLLAISLAKSECALYTMVVPGIPDTPANNQPAAETAPVAADSTEDNESTTNTPQPNSEDPDPETDDDPAPTDSPARN